MSTTTVTEGRTITISVKKVERGCGWSMTTTYYLLVKEGKKTLSRRQVSQASLVRSWVEAWGLRNDETKALAARQGGLWKVEYTPSMMIKSVTKL